MQDLNREINRLDLKTLKSIGLSSLLFSDTLVGSDLVRPTLMGQTQTNGIENTQVISKYFLRDMTQIFL